MNFLTLEYFLAVAEELNISKAAQRLYISQQSLSSSIIKLEKNLGVALFNRAGGLSLTYAGSRLVSSATQIIDIKSRMLNEIDDISKNRRGEIRIGISHTRGCSILPQLLPEFKKSQPLVEITLMEGNTETLENKLNHGAIDLMFGFLPIMLNNVETIELAREKLYLVVPKTFCDDLFMDKSDFMRGKFSESCDIAAFKDCPMIMLKAGNRVRTMTDALFNQKDITPNIVVETDNIETAFALAVKGMGVTVYPEMFLKDFRHFHDLDADFFPLKYETMTGTLAIGYSSKRYLSAATKGFIRHAVRVFSARDELSLDTTN